MLRRRLKNQDQTAHRHERALVRSRGVSGMRTAALPQRRKTGLARRRNMNAQVRDLARTQWRCLLLTRTRRKLLSCCFATPWLSPALCPETEREASVEPARPPR
jgi:hypothetical protein